MSPRPRAVSAARASASARSAVTVTNALSIVTEKLQELAWGLGHRANGDISGGVAVGSDGSAYVTGFTLLQENVSDELRGRTFATLYTVVRLCLLVALTVGPFIASALGAISDAWVDNDIEVGSITVSLPGVRLALWMGGVVTILAGFMARRRMRRLEPEAVPSEGTA